jgi:hypothetical protein
MLKERIVCSWTLPVVRLNRVNKLIQIQIHYQGNENFIIYHNCDSLSNWRFPKFYFICQVYLGNIENFGLKYSALLIYIS